MDLQNGKIHAKRGYKLAFRGIQLAAKLPRV